MTDEIIVEGGKYISSKRASETTGYAQDYIGQLSRKGLIDAKRIGGLWYVSMDSLASYKERSESVKPKSAYVPNVSQPIEAIVSFDGKDYISATRAAELTGYHQDYVGQLARAGKVLSRQIGNRWYVERQGILSHKKEKDSMLAAVQAESVGLRRPHESLIGSSERIARDSLYNEAGPHFTYIAEGGDLLPVLQTTGKRSEENKVPIRVVEERPMSARNSRDIHIIQPKSAWQSGISWIAASAATIVIVLSIGYVAVTNSAQYARIEAVISDNQTASALLSGTSEIFLGLIDRIEHILAPEILYQRL